MEKYENFATLEELTSNLKMLEKLPAVYGVFYKGDKPKFLEVGTGGHFKGRNPNVAIELLEEKWVNGVQEIYIGKATDLRSRLSTYIRFGNTIAVGHWGGRYIWQIADRENLVFAWKYIEEQDPRQVEAKLLQEFKLRHGKYPFANINA